MKYPLALLASLLLMAGTAQAGQIVTNGKMSVSLGSSDLANFVTNPPSAILLRRSVGGESNWVPLVTLPITATNFIDSGLSPQWNYCYSGAFTMPGALTGTWTTIGCAYPYPPPVILTQPATVSGVVGQSVTFNVQVAPCVLTNYQWYANSTAISGATNASLTFTVPASTNPPLYSVVVANGGGTNYSNAAMLLIVNAPSLQGGGVRAIP